MCARRASPSRDGGGLTVDGWANFLSGLGDARVDKRLANRFCYTPITMPEARALYRGSDMGARIVEARVKEMWRPGFEVVIKDLTASPDEADEQDDKTAPVATPGNPWTTAAPRPNLRTDGKRVKRRQLRIDAEDKQQDLSKRAQRKWRKLRGRKRFREAQHYANAYGGGAVLIGVDDGQPNWALPLIPEKVRNVKFLMSLEPEELTPIAWYEELGDNFGEPMMYQVTARTQGSYVSQPLVYVHASRLIVFDGVKTSRAQELVNTWFGDSIYNRCRQVLSDFDIGFAALGIILQEFSLAVMKIKGLHMSVTTDEGKKKIYARLAAYALGKSIANVGLLDAENESLERVNASVSGVGDLLEKLMQRLAAAFDMPLTVLMGTSPAGLNATGASDIRQWYDDIANERDEKIDEPLQFVFGLILRTLNGGIEPGEWCLEWRPMWQKDPKQEAEIFNTYAQADNTNIQNALYTADEARKSRFGDADGYGTTIKIDQDSDSYEPSAEDIASYAASKAAIDPTKPIDPNAPVDPNAPNMQPGGGAAKVADQAMNGAQITSLIEVVTNVATKAISRESGLAILKLAFLVDDEQANALLGPTSFTPVEPPAPPSPFGGGAPKPPGATGEKPQPKVDPIPAPAKESKPAEAP